MDGDITRISVLRHILLSVHIFQAIRIQSNLPYPHRLCYPVFSPGSHICEKPVADYSSFNNIGIIQGQSDVLPHIFIAHTARVLHDGIQPQGIRR